MTLRSDAWELAATSFWASGVEARNRAVCGALRSVIGVRSGQNGGAHAFSLRLHQVDSGGGIEDEGVEGQGIDDQELLDVFRVRVREHEAEQTAEGVADDCRV